MISVETAMKPMITQFSFFSIPLLNVLRKETEVYAAPIMEVIAAQKAQDPRSD